MILAPILFAFLAVNVHATMSTSLHTTDMNNLLEEEAELVVYIARWEWHPDLQTRWEHAQSLRRSLREFNEQSPRMQQLPHSLLESVEEVEVDASTQRRKLPKLDPLLHHDSVGAYFLAHYLATHRGPVYVAPYDFEDLLVNQRRNLHGALLRHCMDKKEKSHGVVEWEHMEIQVCPRIFDLEKVLPLLVHSPLPLLLQSKRTWDALEQKELKAKMPRAPPTYFSWWFGGATSTAATSKPAPPVSEGDTKRFRVAWPDLSCRSSVDCVPNTTGATVNAAATKAGDGKEGKKENETKEEEEEEEPQYLKELKADIRRENRIILGYLHVATRLRLVLTQEHLAIVQKAYEWSEEATSMDQL